MSQQKSLKARIISASIWTFGGHFLSQLLKLISNLIITRILAPEMFGVMAVIMLIIVGLSMLTDIGLSTNVVQSNETEDPEYMNTIWSIQILKGLLIWFMIVLMAGTLIVLSNLQLIPNGTTYANPDLPYYLIVVGLISVFSAFEPTWVLLAAKHFKLKEITLIELASQVLSFITTILLAFWYLSVWALVLGTVSSSIYRLILTYWFNEKPLNKWCLNVQHAKNIIHFGKWIIISTMFGYVVNNGDRIMLGGMVSEKLMGLHSIAYLFMLSIMGVYGKFLTNVAYPALSDVKNDSRERLKNTYYKFRYISDLGLLLVAGFLWMSAETIISLLYDNRYEEVGKILRIMGIGLIAARYNVSDQLFLSLNKPKYSTINIFVKVVALLILFPLAFKYHGFYGAIWATIIASYCSIPIILYLMYKQNVISLKKELITLPLFFVGLMLGKIFNYLINIIT